MTLKELSSLLGLFQQPPTVAVAVEDSLTPKLMQLLIRLRAEARQRKDFPLADRIRQGLLELGVTLEDRKDGTHWVAEVARLRKE